MRAYLVGETAEFEREVRFSHSDGSIRTMFARGVAVRDATGKPIRFVGTGVDITDLKHAEEALRAREARFRALVQNSSDIILLFDSEGTVLYQSPSIERLLGYRPEDWIGRNVFHDPIVHPDDAAAKQVFFEKARNHPGAPVTAEFRLRHADGSWRDVEAVGQSFLHDPGVAGVVANYRDFTERKRAEEALAHERFLLNTLMDHIPDQIYFKDQESRFLRINQAQAEVFGLGDAGQAIGKTDFDFFTEEHARAAYEDEQQIMRTGQPLVGQEEKETFGEGRVRWVSSTKMPFRDKEGTIVGTFGVSRDITKLKQVEESLRASERRFRVFVDHATDAFFLHDDTSRVLDVNRQACESLGYTRDELTGMQPFDFDLDVTPATIEEINRKHVAGEMVTFRTRHRRKDGTVFPVEVRDQAFWEGGRRFAVSLVRDITDQIRAEEALAERARLASLAADVGVALTGADTLPGILQPCAEALVRHLRAALARIWTLNEAENVLELQASAGMYTRTDGTYSRVPIDGHFKIGLIAQQRRPYLTNDVLNDPCISDPEWAGREGLVASAGHPLMVQDRVVGVMVLFAPTATGGDPEGAGGRG